MSACVPHTRVRLISRHSGLLVDSNALFRETPSEGVQAVPGVLGKAHRVFVVDQLFRGHEGKVQHCSFVLPPIGRSAVHRPAVVVQHCGALPRVTARTLSHVAFAAGSGFNSTGPSSRATSRRGTCIFIAPSARWLSVCHPWPSVPTGLLRNPTKSRARPPCVPTPRGSLASSSSPRTTRRL